MAKTVRHDVSSKSETPTEERRFPMSISDSLLPEFDMEMSNTRRALERAPLDKADGNPHKKPMPPARRAAPLADPPGWPSTPVPPDELDFSPGYTPATVANTEELLA